MKEKILFSFLATLFLAGVSVFSVRTDLLADENQPIAGVAVLEGEVFYWPVPTGESRPSDFPAPGTGICSGEIPGNPPCPPPKNGSEAPSDYPAPETRLVALERDLRTISLLSGLDFQPRSREIRPESLPVLDQLAELLDANPDLSIRIAVRPEKTGKPGTDSARAGERAGQIRDYLASKGIEDSRMTAEATKAPAGDQGRRAESQVEITITDQDQNLNQPWMKLKKTTDFYAGDEVKTGAGKVKILFSDGAVIALRPATHIKIINASRVRVFRGGVLGLLEKFQSDRDFAVDTVNAGISTQNGGFAAAFLNGTSTFNALKGGLSWHRGKEPGKSLPPGEKIIIQNGKEPDRPKSTDAGEIRKIQEEFSLRNFDLSQPLFDEEIRKRLERIPPAAPEKSPAPLPGNQTTFPPAGTQAITPLSDK